MIPEIIMYLLSLRYPESDKRRLQPVCYIGAYQLVVPVFPPGQTINLVGRPASGVYAWIEYSLKFGTQMVPNVFTGVGTQYGSQTYNGILTQRFIQDPLYFLVVITEQEPSHGSITNISPIGQYYEAYGEFLVITSPNDMEIITDALRRIHTSEASENMQLEAANLLREISKKTGVR